MYRFFMRVAAVILAATFMFLLWGGLSHAFISANAVGEEIQRSPQDNFISDYGFESDSMSVLWDLKNATSVDYPEDIATADNRRGILLEKGWIKYTCMLESKKYYTFSAETLPLSGKFRLQIELVNAFGNTISTPVKFDYEADEGKWLQHNYHFSTTNDSVGARVSIQYLGGGSKWKQYVDNVSLTSLVPNKVLNGDFEGDAIGKQPAFWDAGEKGAGLACQTMQLPEDIAQGHGNAMYMRDITDTKGFSILSNYIVVTPGDTYHLRVEYWLLEADNNPPMYLQFYDAENHFISQGKNVEVGEVGKWSIREIKCVAPDNASYARVRFQTNNPQTCNVYLDNITVTRDCKEHAPGAEATCSSPQVCTGCGKELKPMIDHSPGAPATCLSAQTCTVCDAELNPPLPHTPGHDATCTTAQVCTSCNTELQPATGHQLIATKPVAATAESEGNIAYWSCSCGKLFADAEGRIEISDEASVVIPKLPRQSSATMIIIVVAVVIVAGLGGTAAVAVIKKKQSKNSTQ